MNRITAVSIAALATGLVLSACGRSPSAPSASSPSASSPSASSLSPTAAVAKLGKHGEYNGGGPYSTSTSISSNVTATALDGSVYKWANANGMIPSSNMPTADLNCAPVGAEDNPRPSSYVNWTCNTTEVTVVIAITGPHSWKVVSLAAD